ncbi:nitrite reductase [Paenibacillus sp. FSL H7-0326]|uniref:nitrite reductase small subunit NirD n=1 Tax=Paenibacillus sp. FSL H7-0326 TaxID=1921144 RepID=UPI00096C5A11|nr:nitrite reductase small subunit NirD [Paenibacillus sp. FSL H7-0326]OMC67227.1 nitrite reductase [Paenibacillus sp. FSL H7-0326]
MNTEAKTFHTAGQISDFPAQLGRVVTIEGIEIAVFHLSNGDICAVENHNPHPKGGPLAEGIVSGHYVYDPLYDWKIDLYTGQVQEPDTSAVQVFPVKTENNTVFIVV